MKPLMTTLAVVILSAVLAAPATAAITPDRNAGNVASALADGLPPGAFVGASFVTISPTAECANGRDDDGDGLVDAADDPGCESGGTDNLEQDDRPAECANGDDDDGDEQIDFPADDGCTSEQDDSELTEGPAPACSNGEDDDGDDRVDDADAGCESASDVDEGSEGFPLPEDTNPAAVADSALAGFPASGANYAILSTGDTLFADDPNDSTGTGQNNGGGSGGHGGEIYDLVTLKVDVDVPSGLNCLRTDFRFLSEEFDEYVGQGVNDAFVAELDQSDFSVNQDSTVSAPHNFAFDSNGNLVSVDTAAFSAGEAAGTTYDGATPAGLDAGLAWPARRLPLHLRSGRRDPGLRRVPGRHAAEQLARGRLRHRRELRRHATGRRARLACERQLVERHHARLQRRCGRRGGRLGNCDGRGLRRQRRVRSAAPDVVGGALGRELVDRGPGAVARHLHGARAAGRRGRQRRLQQPEHVHDHDSGHRR
jgi:hypothetical protein